MAAHLDTISAPSLLRLIEVVGVGVKNSPVGGILFLEGGNKAFEVSQTDLKGNFKLKFFVNLRPRPQCGANNQCEYGLVFGAANTAIL